MKTLNDMLDHYKQAGAGGCTMCSIADMNSNWKDGEIFKVPQGTPIRTPNTIQAAISSEPIETKVEPPFGCIEGGQK